MRNGQFTISLEIRHRKELSSFAVNTTGAKEDASWMMDTGFSSECVNESL